MANKANNKSSKSNKTAHVLNLLTEPGEAAEGSAPAGAPPKHASRPAPPDNSAEVAESIRNALEEDLLAELEEEPASAPQPAPEPEPAPVPQPAPVPEPAPVPQPAPAPEPAPVPQPAPAPEPAPVPQPAPELEPESAVPEEHKGGVTYLNVMQALVEDKVDSYMERFHMCTCDRCRTDVIALTLTSLPAKYIVVPDTQEVPMLTVYEGRYSAAVTAQLMWACQKVAEHPRHASGENGEIRLGAPRHND